MKKILLITFMFFGFLSFAQEFKAEGKTLTGIFEAEGKSKSEIFSIINKWISINYNSSKNVIQMNDLESGTIIVKGINEIKTENEFAKSFSRWTNDYNYYEFRHLIEINIKDNKYRIKYSIIEITSKISPIDCFNYDCINLSGVEQNVIDEYNEKADHLLKMEFIGKKKRDDFKSKTKAYLESVNNIIIDNEKSTMLSIEKLILSNTKDSW